jgi:hypothetical protein
VSGRAAEIRQSIGDADSVVGVGSMLLLLAKWPQNFPPHAEETKSQDPETFAQTALAEMDPAQDTLQCNCEPRRISEIERKSRSGVS